MSMSKKQPFLEVLDRYDSDFARRLEENMQREQKNTALPAKIKALMIMALDAAHGDRKSVAMLAKQARNTGASDQEILETVKLVFNTCGVQGLIPAVAALKK